MSFLPAKPADLSAAVSSTAWADIDIKAMPRVLSRLWRQTLQYPWRAGGAMLAALGAAIMNLATPRLLGHAVDEAHALLLHAAAGRHTLAATAMLIVGVCAARGLLTGLQGYLGESLAQCVGFDLRLAFYAKLQELPFAFYDAVHSGDLIARGMLDLEGVRAFLESAVLRVITLVLLVGVGSWRLLHTDLQLTLYALAFVPFVIWRAANMGAQLRQTWQRLQRLMSRLTLTMEENLQGVRVVRAFASQDHEMQKFDRESDEALRLSNLRIGIRMRSTSLMNFAYYVSMGLVLWKGGHRVQAGTLSVGTLTEFLTFITLLQQPLRQIGMIVNSSARATSSGARLFSILDLEVELGDREQAHPVQLDAGCLRFDAVGFAYDGKQVLSDISFEVGPGRTLGIVGAPGSGKSTLAHLVPRFYDVSLGCITIDGHDIRDLPLAQLRKVVSLVQQDVFLFDTSVRDNIAYARPDAAHEQVTDAAKDAQLHEQVEHMSAAYDTQVGERGVGLSGGQRQRVVLARSLLTEPLILVLDDATAAVDTLTEQRIRSALEQRSGYGATLIIAHRLTSLLHADEIIVLDSGRIVERGTHAQLLLLGGRYADLWRLQSRSEEHVASSNVPGLERVDHLEELSA